MTKDFQSAPCQRGLCARGCSRQDHQLNTYDYLADVPGNDRLSDLVEVQFKNTRKDYFVNSNHLQLRKGDIVAVEATPGHDIGTVTLTGSLVPLQMSKTRLKADAGHKRIYRIARDIDLQKWEESKALEHDTMIKSRQIAKDLGLDMKIGDVEYQGDGNKAIFYYIADQRVDFRVLIKVLAEEFRVRIEMRQIGARQEAGRIGGFGPCGRELCCATWIKNFNTVSTQAARIQDVSLTPQKLAGQCAKLKCCLNYEVSTYLDAQQQLPPRDTSLYTRDAEYRYVKADALAGLLTYATDRRDLSTAVTIPVSRALEIIELNARGEKPEDLLGDGGKSKRPAVVDLAEQDSLTRFDKERRGGKRRKGRSDQRQRRNDSPRSAEGQQTPTDNAAAPASAPHQGRRPADEGRQQRQRPRRDNRRDDRRQHSRPRNAEGQAAGERPAGNRPSGNAPQSPKGDNKPKDGGQPA